MATEVTKANAVIIANEVTKANEVIIAKEVTNPTEQAAEKPKAEPGLWSKYGVEYLPYMLIAAALTLLTSIIIVISVTSKLLGPYPASSSVEDRSNVTESYSLLPPAAPSSERVTVDANYVSYSVEFSYMADYAGNKSHPNLFSRQMVQNLYDVSGAYPIIRTGGSSQNNAIYVANQTEGVILKFANRNADQPYLLTIGPTWAESYQQLPNGTQYIYGLNFYKRNDTTLAKYASGGDGLHQTIAEAEMVYEAISKSLLAFEIGNEPDAYAAITGHRTEPWTVQKYVDEWIEYGTNISQAVAGKDVLKIFQGCAFVGPHFIGNDSKGLQYWTVQNALQDGMATSGLAKSVSDHQYMGANCNYQGVGPSIASTIFNRTHMTSLLYYHEYMGNFTATTGASYILGETNSLGCQGGFNISDVMAAAVWSVDYVFYLSTLKVNRVHFHGGTPYRYAAWQATYLNETNPHVKPLYYGNLFAATAFAGGNKKVEILVNNTSMGAYAIYGQNSSGTYLESVVAVNVQVYNSTFTTNRPFASLKLPAQFRNASVLRLTNPGINTAADIKFAGQYIDENGKIAGQRYLESVNNTEVLVGGGEAVLISTVIRN